MSDEHSPGPLAIDSEGRICGPGGERLMPLPVGWERDERLRGWAALFTLAPEMAALLRELSAATPSGALGMLDKVDALLARLPSAPVKP